MTPRKDEHLTGTESVRRARPASAARNVLSNWTAFFVTSVVSFFLSPYVVHQLGDASYGVWVLIGSLTGYLGLLDLGVRGAVTRYTASFSSSQDHQGASGVVSSALGIFLLAGAAALAIAGLLAFTVLDRFQIPSEQLVTARLVLILVGFNVAVSLVSGVFGGVVTGLQRFDLANAVEIAAALLRAGAIVAALSAGEGLVALALIHGAFALAIGLAYAILALRLYPQLRVSWKQGTRAHMRLIFSFSIFSFLLHISTYLIYYTGSLVIGIFLPVSMITFFAIAANLATYARAVISGISATVTPLVSALQAKGQASDVSRVLLRAIRYATLVMLAIGITFLVRAETFIRLWMGPQYASLSGETLKILTIALILVAGSQVCNSAMLGLVRHRAVVPVVVAEALVNLTLSLWWVRTVGVIGVAWATTLPSLMTSLLWWPWYVRRVLGIPVVQFLVSSWLRPACAMLPFALATLAVELWWPPTGLSVFFVQVAALLPLAGVGAWFVALDVNDRTQVRQSVLIPAMALIRGR
jgi:O-antigen/teichoic acid export membrane protein